MRRRPIDCESTHNNNNNNQNYRLLYATKKSTACTCVPFARNSPSPCGSSSSKHYHASPTADPRLVKRTNRWFHGDDHPWPARKASKMRIHCQEDHPEINKNDYPRSFEYKQKFIGTQEAKGCCPGRCRTTCYGVFSNRRDGGHTFSQSTSSTATTASSMATRDDGALHYGTSDDGICDAGSDDGTSNDGTPNDAVSSNVWLSCTEFSCISSATCTTATAAGNSSDNRGTDWGLFWRSNHSTEGMNLLVASNNNRFPQRQSAGRF